MKQLFGGRYDGRRVLLTGHTGFKGSWLALWLNRLGASVAGYALDPATTPNHYDLLKPDVDSTIADIRDLEALRTKVKDFNPEIVFHLAAQPIVRLGYAEPVATFSTNVMGTVDLLEACRGVSSVKAVVVITSDKCYENNDPAHSCLETDPMGGDDPYSASKGCAEVVTNAYRSAYFNLSDYGSSHHTLVASARAGNAVGGGDWAEDRLIPDLMKAASQKHAVSIRNPKAVRPWQHALDPLSGYLWLGAKLLNGDTRCADGWNFGPDNASAYSVEDVLAMCMSHWSDIDVVYEPPSSVCREAESLTLDCSKAAHQLEWRPVWDIETTLERTAAWYKAYYQDQTVLTSTDLDAYVADATAKGLPWV